MLNHQITILLFKIRIVSKDISISPTSNLNALIELILLFKKIFHKMDKICMSFRKCCSNKLLINECKRNNILKVVLIFEKIITAITIMILFTYSPVSYNN